MTEELFVPKLGQTVEEVTLVKWLVKDGAKVNQGQEVMEVETDKAVFPVEANARGYIHIGPYHEGQVVPVLTVVAIIGKEDEQFVSSERAASPQEEAAGESPAAATAEAGAPAPAGEAGKVFASPRARQLAAKKSVDLSQVTPSGYGGERVAERDVLAFISQQPKATPVAQRMAAGAGLDLRTLSGTGPGGRIVKDDVVRAAIPPAPAVEAPAAPVAG